MSCSETVTDHCLVLAARAGRDRGVPARSGGPRPACPGRRHPAGPGARAPVPRPHAPLRPRGAAAGGASAADAVPPAPPRGLPATIPANGTSPDPSGRVGFHSDAGRVSTDPGTGDAFFRSLGANGRSCGTCHQPSQGMSLSAAAARRRFRLSRRRGPALRPGRRGGLPEPGPGPRERPEGRPRSGEGPLAPAPLRPVPDLPAGPGERRLHALDRAPATTPPAATRTPPTRGTRPTPRRGSSRSTGGR